MNNTGWLITHKNCLDGATAAAIGQQCGLIPVFVEPDQVARGFEAISDQKPVYLADVSLKNDQYPLYSSRIHQLLDHHQSALGLRAFPHVTIDLSKSGSGLFYEYAVTQGWLTPSKNWDRLIASVERYDLWQPCHEPGQNLNRLFHDQGYEWFQQRFGQGWAPYQPSDQDSLARLISQESQFVREQMGRAVRTFRPFPMVAIPLSGEGAVNEVAHKLLAQGAALVVFLKADGRLSVRSDTRIDAAVLMEQMFHGGGHARAAGGRMETPGPYGPQDAQSLLLQIGHYLDPG